MNNKEKIFNVSVDLFSEYGYDGVSIRNHYSSKESILDSILNYYIFEMTKEEIPLSKASENLDIGFDYFYKKGLDVYASKLSEDKMMKITRIILIESYHNEKINGFIKRDIMEYAVKGWRELFDLMKEKNLIQKECNSKQLAESFYYYGLFLLIEHFIINYPEDDEEFLRNLKTKSENHMKLLFNSVKIDDCKIRLENPADYLEVENLVRDSFWNVYRPGAFEHYIVHNLRNHESFIKELAYVIEKRKKIIAHINYSAGRICFENGNFQKALVLGPICVDRKWQNQGYGTKLINHSLKIIAEKDIPYVFVIGDENYYKRFGFETASKYKFYLKGTDRSEENPFFMIKIFDEEKIGMEWGIFENPDVFDIDPQDVDEFDRKFEYKEKRIQEGQLSEIEMKK